jgi:hypothetical protein
MIDCTSIRGQSNTKNERPFLARIVEIRLRARTVSSETLWQHVM